MLKEWIDTYANVVFVASTVDPVGHNYKEPFYSNIDRSIIATKPIQRSDILVSLKQEACLNYTKWLNNLQDAQQELANKVQKSFNGQGLSPTLKTVLALLNEYYKGELSKWYGYIQQIPSNILVPMTWDEKHRDLLNVTSAYLTTDYDVVVNLYNNNVVHIADQFSTLWSREKITLDIFIWAYAAVSSRAFVMQNNGEPTLLPVIDMANHHPNACNAELRFSDEKNEYQLIAIHDIQESNEVTISYGDLPNAQLLCRYGFVLPEPTISDSICMSESEILSAYQETLMQLNEDENIDCVKRQSNAQENEAVNVSVQTHPNTFGTNEIMFLNGNAEEEFGLSEGVLTFAMSHDLRMDLLEDVLSRVLQRKDEIYSHILHQNIDQSSTHAMKMIHQLVKYERDICRRVLLSLIDMEVHSDSNEETENMDIVN